MKTYLQEKMEIFDDLRIPWPTTIESDWEREKKKHPNSDPELILDRLAKGYIEYGMFHPTESGYAWLKNKYGNKSLSRRRIVADLGDEVFGDLLKANLISVISNAMYELK